jgi:excisionase family DNA binding protein
MKLIDLFEDTKSREDETVINAPPPGKLGEYITSAQAAKMLGVEMSRVRQLVGEGKLKSYKPEEGRRDHMLKVSEVRALKDDDKKNKGGRPTKRD